MKQINYIFLFVAFTLLSCGRAMEKEEKMKEQDSSVLSENTIDKTELDFLTDSLSDKQKELFGKRAIQKLEDYYNYIEILSNKNYDTTLRNHAMVLATELFLDKKNIEPIIDSYSNNSTDSIAVSIHNVSISSVPVTITDSTYRGELVFEERIKNKTKIQHINFIIKKGNKHFGQEEHSVWETYLDYNK
jgi:hypothetical protein